MSDKHVLSDFSTSHIELSREALKANLDFIRQEVKEGTRISTVVKGNAYGHGIELLVPEIEKSGIDHFSVFSSDEAFRVRSVVKPTTDVMVMGMIQDTELEWAIRENVQFYVFDMERLDAAVVAAKSCGRKARVHIEVETGMNRTGFSESDLHKVADILRTNERHLTFEGLCTHYAGAESIANHVRVKAQIKVFDKRYNWFVANGLKPKVRHTACSAASLSYPETQMDLVRIGILTYGYWPSKETFIHYIGQTKEKKDTLRRIISWKSHVMTLKDVETGKFIGYGTTYLTDEPVKIAIVPVGYSHGFSRSLSNQGRVLIRGQRLSVIGIVNMNLLLVNVTTLPDVERGDEVVIIGNQGGNSITVASFSEMSDQLNYELLTRLPTRIPRKMTD